MVAPAAVIENVIQTFRLAAEANLLTQARVGNVIELHQDNSNEVMLTADLHGNRLNFEALCQIADLSTRSDLHLVMQEVCHGGPTYPDGSGCMSHLLLEDIAQLKLQFPQQFHFLLSNHEWSEWADFPITKAKTMLNVSFRCGMQQMYGTATDEVHEAYLDFIGSCPIAIRIAQRVFVCHSAPDRIDERGFDPELLRRPLGAQDLAPHSDLFRLLWGRDFSEENARLFAELVDADVIIHGHEPCDEGFQVPNDRQIIIDCCGRVASYVVLPTTRACSQQEIVDKIQFLPH